MRRVVNEPERTVSDGGVLHGPGESGRGVLRLLFIRLCVIRLGRLRFI